LSYSLLVSIYTLTRLTQIATEPGSYEEHWETRARGSAILLAQDIRAMRPVWYPSFEGQGPRALLEAEIGFPSSGGGAKLYAADIFTELKLAKLSL